MATDVFKDVGSWLDEVLKPYNYHVAPLAKSGKPGKVIKAAREYRLQLIDKHRDTSSDLTKNLKSILEAEAPKRGITDITFNQISPNSSKFPSYSFTMSKQTYDLVIARGANKGENFETTTIADLNDVYKSELGARTDKKYIDLLNQLNAANKDFASREIKDVKKRTGSTRKEGVPIAMLNAVIGDIVLTDTTGMMWYISLKDVGGGTFSSYSGASSLFNNTGDLQPKSFGAEFLRAFGVDLNRVQSGFDERKNKIIPREPIPVTQSDATKLKAIFERAWGVNYFYVRRNGAGWKVFWLDRDKLNRLTSNMRVTNIKYPSKQSKQITVMCETSEQKYVVEVRNSSGGEYPNDIKFKVV